MDYFKKRIFFLPRNSLPEKWEKVKTSDGKYFKI